MDALRLSYATLNLYIQCYIMASQKKVKSESNIFAIADSDGDDQLVICSSSSSIENTEKAVFVSCRLPKKC
jgi:hypothetical protein